VSRSFGQLVESAVTAVEESKSSCKGPAWDPAWSFDIIFMEAR
jgi:hypothetical protein